MSDVSEWEDRMTRLYGPQVQPGSRNQVPDEPGPEQAEVQNEPVPGPSGLGQVHSRATSPSPPSQPGTAQIEDEPIAGPSGHGKKLRRTWNDIDPNAQDFVKNAPYAQETVIYEDKDVRAKVKKTKHLKTHYYKLSDILYRLIIEPKRSNQLILVKSTHSIIYNALKEIWAQLRSYIRQPDWHNHRVIFTICDKGIKSGIGISYYTLR